MTSHRSQSVLYVCGAIRAEANEVRTTTGVWAARESATKDRLMRRVSDPGAPLRLELTHGDRPAPQALQPRMTDDFAVNDGDLTS